jgi:hypothetical protein
MGYMSGRYVWPKQQFVKNPATGKRVARLVPEADRGRYDRPHRASSRTSCGSA